MIDSNATAEVFLAAFRALSKEQRRAIVAGIAADEKCGEDLVDLARLLDRRDEPSRPFRDYLAEKKS